MTTEGNVPSKKGNSDSDRDDETANIDLRFEGDQLCFDVLAYYSSQAINIGDRYRDPAVVFASGDLGAS